MAVLFSHNDVFPVGTKTYDAPSPQDKRRLDRLGIV
jgi:hypothetical protein